MRYANLSPSREEPGSPDSLARSELMHGTLPKPQQDLSCATASCGLSESSKPVRTTAGGRYECNENFRVFRGLDEEIELAPILEQLAGYPPTKRVLTDEAERRLPLVVGGIGLTVPHSFRIIDPQLRNRRPTTGTGWIACSICCGDGKPDEMTGGE